MPSADGLRAERPQLVLIVPDEGHAEALGRARQIETTGQRHAGVALARPFGLDVPAGLATELGGVHVEVMQEHGSVLPRWCERTRRTP